MRRILPALALAVLTAVPAGAQDSPDPDSAFWSAFRWRSIGPANMSGRVTDIEGVPGTGTFYVAAATGGIWKTTNHGTTFRPVFDDQRVVSMGDLAIAPSDPDIVWAGTGEEDSRNSISPGGGIYRSTDGGMTWELKGLETTQVIGRIVVHPENPDIVWVAALGHIWDTNPERGLYKTTDGGETWRLVKFISDRAGFVDIAIHPEDPDILFASSWERIRGPYFLESGGPGSALWKSTDGGESWTEVEGGGFPSTNKGRIGLAISRSDPDVMYAMVEAEKGEGVGELDEEEAATSGLMGSGLYRSEDGGVTWRFMNDRNTRPFYYSQVRVAPDDPDLVYWSSTPVQFSRDGGETVGQATIGIHVDHHAMWWDTENPDHFITGNDGGIGITWDRGGTYVFPNSFAIGQFYAIGLGMGVPYRVCGGLQDNGTWCGPSRRANGGIDNHMWFTVNGGDGFYALMDPRNQDLVYAESQGGNMARVNVATGERTGLDKPDWKDRTRALADTVVLLREEYGEDPPRDVRRRIDRLEARIAEDSARYDLRWNWNTPFLLSPHDPDVFYAGANKVLKSTMRGDSLETISPDLTYADTMKIRVSTKTTGGITPDVTGAETHATIVALAESPLVQGMLFVGTDDGRVWISPNDGADWRELTDRFPGVPEGTWVSRIEPSSHDADRFYVTFDGHRTNDFTPYVYVTDDGGRRFRSIAEGLPTGAPDFVHVIREDPVNEDLLFVGTDVGAYVSTDRGASWRRFMEGLPTVPVHDLKIHPRDAELVAGTHGRSIWIVDIAPLQDRGASRLADAALFRPKPGLQYEDRPIGGESPGHRWFEVPSVEYGAEIAYWISESAVPEAVAEGEEEVEAMLARLTPEQRARLEAMPPERRQAMRERFAAMTPEQREAAMAMFLGRETPKEPEERPTPPPAGEVEPSDTAGAGPAGGPGRPGARQERERGARQERGGGAQARIIILDAAGDTVRTMDGPASMGLHRVHWNLRTEADPEPLSPSERADSLKNMRILHEIADSLVAEGTAERDQMDRLIGMIESGNMRGLFRMYEGAGRRGGGFVERPGESYPSGEQAEAAGGGMRGVMMDVFSAARERGLGYGMLRSRRGRSDAVEPAEYTVVVKLGDHELRQPLTVVRAPGYTGESELGF